MDLNKIATYPMQSDEWVKTVLIGGIMIFFSFLLIPLFIAYGYIVRAIRSSLADDPTPPVFSDWEKLLVDGAQAFVIGIIYLLVPLIVAGVTVGGSIMVIATGGEAGAAFGVGGMFFGLMISTLLSIAFGYFAIVALVNFAREERFGAAFDLDVIKTVALNKEYAIAWLVSVVAFILVGIVGMIPLVGWMFAPFASFYAAVVAANLWAGGFDQAIDSTGRMAQPRDEEALV